MDGKKIDAAFRRLYDCRQAVGSVGDSSETPEQEAQRLEDDIKAAQAAGDISTIMRLMAKAATLRPSDYIKHTLGGLRFMYYTYLRKFNIRPLDLIDMVDGLLFLDAEGFINKTAIEDAKLAKEKNND